MKNHDMEYDGSRREMLLNVICMRRMGVRRGWARDGRAGVRDDVRSRAPDRPPAYARWPSESTFYCRYVFDSLS